MRHDWWGFFQSWDFSREIHSLSKPLWKPAMFQALDWPWDSKVIKDNHPYSKMPWKPYLIYGLSYSVFSKWTPGQHHLSDNSSFLSFLHKSMSLHDPQGHIYWDSVQYPAVCIHLGGLPDLWNWTCFNLVQLQKPFLDPAQVWYCFPEPCLFSSASYLRFFQATCCSWLCFTTPELESHFLFQVLEKILIRWYRAAVFSSHRR